MTQMPWTGSASYLTDLGVKSTKRLGLSILKVIPSGRRCVLMGLLIFSESHFV